MQVRRDAKWTAFHEAMEHNEDAVRLKQIRSKPIEQGRAELSLFELAPTGERPHPRLRFGFVEVSDPSPPPLPEPLAWADAGAFRAWLAGALGDPAMLANLGNPPTDSPQYWRNVVRAGRITRLLDHARAAVDARQSWAPDLRDAAHYAIAELGDLAYAGDIQFDNDDTGTYHSFKHDQAFVHVLELLRASLPDEGTDAFALLPPEQQYAIRRQTAQVTNHLDFLMRHKYAYEGITETDIERTLGGFLIDRETRQIASEDPATRTSLQPRHQLLRVDPGAEHPRTPVRSPRP